MIAILEPIYEATKASEADGAHIGYVVDRWNGILSDWHAVERVYPQIGWDEIRSLWTTRSATQHNVFNWAAWALDPNTTDKPLDENTLDNIVRLLRYVIGDDVYAGDQIEHLFYAFRSRQPPFTSAFLHWKRENKAIIFWLRFQAMHNCLADIAIRLFTAIANSVPCERSFSTMNYLHSSIRNCLSIDRSNRLAFIYVNHRVLARLEAEEEAQKTAERLDQPIEPPRIVDWLNLTPEEALSLEDEALEMPIIGELLALPEEVE